VGKTGVSRVESSGGNGGPTPSRYIFFIIILHQIRNKEKEGLHTVPHPHTLPPFRTTKPPLYIKVQAAP
jgi:hypothetical protein